MEMRVVLSDMFVFFSTLSPALHFVMHRARRALRARVFVGVLASHNGAKMFILHSIVHEHEHEHEHECILLTELNVSLKGAMIISSIHKVD